MARTARFARFARVARVARLAALLAAALLPPASAAADAVVLPGVDSGHYAHFGFPGIGVHHSGVDTLLVGWFADNPPADHTLHGFLVYDLSTLPPDVVIDAVTLRLATGASSYVSPDPSETLVFHEVTTDPALVLADHLTEPAISESGWPIYVDLGDGPVLASVVATAADNASVLEVPLEPAGIAAFQSAVGGQVALGLALASLTRGPGVTEIFPADAPAENGVFEVELELAPLCDDGVDNDGDGSTDLGDDLGCTDALDASETDPAFPCDDGVDNDGDGGADVAGDPGCAAAGSPSESPACNDGIDNDGDGGVDFDGGALANGGSAVAPPDPQCGVAHRARETPGRCGLGAELLLALYATRRWARAGSRRGSSPRSA